MSTGEIREYRPELLPRRGEWTAWGLAVVTGLSLIPLRLSIGTIPAVAWFFWGLLMFSAASVSLGNWMDRRTRLGLGPSGVSFSNGLRNAQLAWDEIREVAVLPARFGKQVRVLGQLAHFEFRLLSAVEFQGETRGRFGFAAGQEILEAIIAAAGLKKISDDAGGAYYSRH
jgi:hypothetical protein